MVSCWPVMLGGCLRWVRKWCRVTAPEVEGVLRLGVAEHLVPQRLPILLTQLRRAFPKVQLSVEVGMSSEILAGMEQGRLDLAITTAGEQPASGERPRAFEQIAILFEEPLVWVRGESMTPVAPGEIVPLALLPAPCFYRRAALEALERSARSWKIVYSSASLPSVQAAVQAGFALTAISRSSALPGMKILDGRESLGQLPTIRVAIYRAPSAGQLLVNSLSEFISETVQHWMFGASELPTFPDVYDRADATSVNRKIPAESSESVAQLAVAPRS